MTRRAWICVTAAYLLLVAGVVVSQVQITRQQDDLERQQERAAAIAANYCEAIRRIEPMREANYLFRLAIGGDPFVSSTCRLIGDRIQEG